MPITTLPGLPYILYSEEYLNPLDNQLIPEEDYDTDTTNLIVETFLPDTFESPSIQEAIDSAKRITTAPTNDTAISKTRIETQKTKPIQTKKRKPELSLDDIKELQRMPINEAAKHCGLGKTKLKRLCRKFNINRWGYRQGHQPITAEVQVLLDYLKKNKEQNDYSSLIETINILTTVHQIPTIQIVRETGLSSHKIRYNLKSPKTRIESQKKKKKKPIQTKKRKPELPLDDIKELQRMPLDEDAKHCGLGKTMLKKRCGEEHIDKWRYREGHQPITAEAQVLLDYLKKNKEQNDYSSLIATVDILTTEHQIPIIQIARETGLSSLKIITTRYNLKKPKKYNHKYCNISFFNT